MINYYDKLVISHDKPVINHWILVIAMEFLHFQNPISSNRTEITQKVPTARQLGDPPDQSDCSQRHGWCRHQIRGPAPEIIVYRYQLWIGEECEKSSKCYYIYIYLCS